MGDLFGGQSADFSECHRHLRIGRNERMAAGEDQPQHVVLDRFHVADLRCVGGVEAVFDVMLRSIETRPPPDRVDRLEASRRNEPGEGIAGNAVRWPCPGGRSEGVVQRFLRPVEIAEQADQRRQHPARLRSIDLLDHAFQRATSVRQGQHSHGPQFDRAETCRWDPPGNLPGFHHVRRLDDVKAGQMLLGFDIGAVGG